MIKLLDKPNIIAADSDYPFGRPRDNTGSGNGTPYNELVFNDYMQFFEKLMNLAQVTPNGLRENEYHGFQLNQALINMIIGVGGVGTGEWINLDLSGSGLSNVGSPYYDASSRVNLYRGMIELRGLLRMPDASAVSPTTVGRITLGGGFYPSIERETYVDVMVLVVTINTGRAGAEAMKIEGDGTMVIPAVAGLTNLQYISLDNICIPLTTGNLNILP